MALRKQTIIENGAPSNGKTNSVIGCMVPPPTINQQHATEDIVSLPQGAATSVQLTPLLEDQIIQMLVDMKE